MKPSSCLTAPFLLSATKSSLLSSTSSLNATWRSISSTQSSSSTTTTSIFVISGSEPAASRGSDPTQVMCRIDRSVSGITSAVENSVS